MGSTRGDLLPFSTVDFDVVALERNSVNPSQRNSWCWVRAGGVPLRFGLNRCPRTNA